eukprot:1191860-Prorocentrum_minimum.AAC.1
MGAVNRRREGVNRPPRGVESQELKDFAKELGAERARLLPLEDFSTEANLHPCEANFHPLEVSSNHREANSNPREANLHPLRGEFAPPW